VKTQVGIIGAGPAGLLLSHILARNGIDSVVLEQETRDDLENRNRAGLLEHTTLELLRHHGVGERASNFGLIQRGINVHFDGGAYRMDLAGLTEGKTTMIYGQKLLVRDMLEIRLAGAGKIIFGARVTNIAGLMNGKPTVSYSLATDTQNLECELVIGTDGSRGVSRYFLKGLEYVQFGNRYPFSWLGVLAEAQPASEELTYAISEFGFALQSMRSPQISRNYIQVDSRDSIANWPDTRIWEELERRFVSSANFKLNRGLIIERSITSMRSQVAGTFQYGPLFLAGDAAHIVPPTVAKGLNLAIFDVDLLSKAIIAYFVERDYTRLESYSFDCARRVWAAQAFSDEMTRLFHRDPQGDQFAYRLQLAHLERLVGSETVGRNFAERYSGFY
jgi:p-hydroxybenzoate 3-monooxygenase